ncbi:MAG: DHH family phosphoesterase [Anaerolineae bacterium]|nr:DHH family phosphoesterase [Anaerolineae bacterium]MDK1079938.1 DHH family phosphoesterase [Anaerolineae bacterium]MDK1118593.1 DHH family phosphoesterase [Anaerolineae bacterium]
MELIEISRIEKLHVEIKERLDTAQNVLIASHIRPDGDAIGSLIGLGLALQNSGKSVQMVLADGVPASFRFLEGSDQVRKEPDKDFDTFISVDCADFKRLGNVLGSIELPDINIDHHVTNQLFGTLNLIEGQEVATAAILTKHLPEWGYEITQPIASALLTGIITDTLGFRTSNMTSEALRQAAALMDTGVNMPEIYMRGLVRRSFAAARYWGVGLSKIDSSNGIVWSALSLEDRQSSLYPGNDDADLINMISAIENHKVGMIFVEQNDNHVKISWRALEPGIDVALIAKHFGGGGHAAAAGADIQGTLDDVQPIVLKTTKEMLGL